MLKSLQRNMVKSGQWTDDLSVALNLPPLPPHLLCQIRCLSSSLLCCPTLTPHTHAPHHLLAHSVPPLAHTSPPGRQAEGLLHHPGLSLNSFLPLLLFLLLS